eukprot:jgi/Mesvir1/25623/Mv01847-RA.1
MATARTALILSGDVGGTNSRFQLWEVEPGATAKLGVTAPGREVFKREYQNENFARFEDVVVAFLRDAQKEIGLPGITSAEGGPQVACFAVAGPVDANRVAFTNRSAWVIDGSQLQTVLGIEQVSLINDFVANGYGLLTLAPSEVHVLQDAPAKPGMPMACIGAGTGLGECFLTAPIGSDEYDTWPSEGGHTEFAPRTPLEIELLAYLKDKFKENHRVSVERIVSGRGIANVYGFMRHRFPSKVDKDKDEEILAAGDRQGAVIAKHASTGYKLCRWTMEIFLGTYGAEAGAVALKYLPFGGLFIAGGIAPKNLQMLAQERKWRDYDIGFLASFRDKGRLSHVARQIPVKVVLVEDIGQRGAHWLAFRMMHRRWEAERAQRPV